MLAFSCPVTATSTECPRRISGHTQDSASLPVSAPLARHLVHEGPVVPQRTEKFCLLLGSAGIHTPSEAKRYLKAVLKYCQCVPMQQAKAGFRWTCAVSCPPLCLQPPQEGRWGQRKVCHVVPDLPHSQALPGDEEKIIQQILNEKIISPDLPFSQQKKTTKPEPSASLCLAHWGEMDMSKWFLLHPHHCGQWEVVRGDQD